ncbi:MAG TPA: RDD family protein [Candidatus Dormibacteraeota bacterium]|nr:RDD family protein [Candidatus Dormibacteraeota bacterium]
MSRTALRVTAGPAVGKLIVVDEDLTLGSAAEIEATLRDPSLSEAHARLSRDHMDEWMVRDLGSTSGTYLNGELLTSIETLYRGDSLRLGDTRLVVVEGAHRPPVAGRVPPRANSVPRFAPLPIEPPVMERAPVEQPFAYERPKIEDRIAPLGRRWRAAVIDNLIAAAIIYGTVSALHRTWVSWVLGLGLALCWDFLFESLRGQTIGKRIMRIKVVRRDESTLRPQHVAARNVLRLLDGAPGPPLIGLLSITASGAKRRQRLGDLAGGTIVVKSDREMSRLPAAVRDRAILAAYPLLWLAPALALAVLEPASTIQPCRASDVTSALAPEKTCLTLGPQGERIRVSLVNAGHTLHWHGYDVQLLATRAHSVKRLHGRATLIAFKVAVTNTMAAPARFDYKSAQVLLNLPVSGEIHGEPELPTRYHFHGFPAVARTKPLQPGATRVGWLRYVVPSSVVPALNVTKASLSFLAPNFSGGYLDGGDIRLSHAANAQGAEAIRVRSD